MTLTSMSMKRSSGLVALQVNGEVSKRPVKLQVPGTSDCSEQRDFKFVYGTRQTLAMCLTEYHDHRPRLARQEPRC